MVCMGNTCLSFIHPPIIMCIWACAYFSVSEFCCFEFEFDTLTRSLSVRNLGVFQTKGYKTVTHSCIEFATTRRFFLVPSPFLASIPIVYSI